MKNRVIRVDGKKLEPYKKVKIDKFYVENIPCFDEVRISDKSGSILAYVKYPETVTSPYMYAVGLSSGVYKPDDVEPLLKLVKKISKALGYKI